MVPEPILRRLEAEFDSPPEALRATAELLLDGATPEFVVLFRRDETGDLGEERVLAVAERLSVLRELDQRRATILEHAEAAWAAVTEGSHTPALSIDEIKVLLNDSVDQDLFDDVEHFLRPREHKAEATVHELGLTTLLDRILTLDLGDQSLSGLAETFVDPAKPAGSGLNSTDEVLGQVVLALSERFGEDPRLRATVRQELSRGILQARPSGAAAKAAREAERAEQRHAESADAQEATPDETAPGLQASGSQESGSQASGSQASGSQASGSQASGSMEHTGSEPEASAADPDIAPSSSSDLGVPESGVPESGVPESGASADAVPDAAETVSAEAENSEAQEPQVSEPQASEPPASGEQDTQSGGQQSQADESPTLESPASESGDPSAATGDSGAPAETASAESSSDGPPAENAPSPESTEIPSQRAKKSPKAKRTKKKDQGRYQELFGLEEPVRRISANRMLALRRAERDGALTLRLKLEPGRELELFRRRFSADLGADTQLGQFLDLVYGHAYDRFVHPSCEKVVRQRTKEKADRETVRSFARSLRAQLMAPGLPDSVCAALRVSGKSAWYVTLGPDGTPRRKMNPNVPTDEAGRGQLADAIVEAIREDEPKALAIPHGKRERAAAKLAQDVLEKLEPEKRPVLVPLDQTASVVWATSANARRRHQNSDNGMRTTLSLARRLRDPLLELIRVEPRGLGLGQNLADVHQGLLRRQLDHTASTCLARVGVDVNRSDQGLLARLPGVSQHLAKAIVQHRSSHGPFQSLRSMQDITDLDEPTWRHVVGFLRIHGGSEVLDGTTIHPDDYDIVAHIAGRENCTTEELFGRAIPRVTPEECGPDVGLKRLLDVLDALRRGTVDPRGKIEDLRNEGVTTFQDLKVDQQLRGRVTNLAEFGAFVDLGIGQDGLIHLSQIPGQKLRDPERLLRVGEVVTVYVVQLDEKTKKIGLSMFQPRHLAEGRAPTLGERMGKGGGDRRRGGSGRGPRRDRDEQPAQTRAARVPEGRRGTMRRGPNARSGDGGSSFGGGSRDDRRPGGRGGSSTPRVITVESEQTAQDLRGHKGELRSLSSLKGLLQKKDDEPTKD